MAGGCAPWRRWVAALLCVLVASYNVAATATQIAAATDPEICIALPGSTPGEPGSAGTHAIKCLLCLPGCTALGMTAPPALAPPSSIGATRIAAPGAIARATSEHTPYAPRGPPARA